MHNPSQTSHIGVGPGVLSTHPAAFEYIYIANDKSRGQAPETTHVDMKLVPSPPIFFESIPGVKLPSSSHQRDMGTPTQTSRGLQITLFASLLSADQPVGEVAVVAWPLCVMMKVRNGNPSDKVPGHRNGLVGIRLFVRRITVGIISRERNSPSIWEAACSGYPVAARRADPEEMVFMRMEQCSNMVPVSMYLQATADNTDPGNTACLPRSIIENQAVRLVAMLSGDIRLQAAVPQDFHRNRIGSGQAGQAYVMTLDPAGFFNQVQIVVYLSRDHGTKSVRSGIIVVVKIDPVGARDICHVREHTMTQGTGLSEQPAVVLAPPRKASDRSIIGMHDGSICRVSIKRRLANCEFEALLTIMYEKKE
ncbi:hypothetical protein QBC44DRAFT_375219 [Cladorrhinum sp. PSN332]|nr:hypothetical protein QBC44DRAFT_375219 [Cladorrhinum sp. PSN332]